MAEYCYKGNKSAVDYTTEIVVSGGRVLEQGKSLVLSAEEVDLLRRNFVLTKVQDDQPVNTGKSLDTLTRR